MNYRGQFGVSTECSQESAYLLLDQNVPSVWLAQPLEDRARLHGKRAQSAFPPAGYLDVLVAAKMSLYCWTPETYTPS
jgi:hypothetical protein